MKMFLLAKLSYFVTMQCPCDLPTQLFVTYLTFSCHYFFLCLSCFDVHNKQNFQDSIYAPKINNVSQLQLYFMLLHTLIVGSFLWLFTQLPVMFSYLKTKACSLMPVTVKQYGLHSMMSFSQRYVVARRLNGGAIYCHQSEKINN